VTELRAAKPKSAGSIYYSVPDNSVPYSTQTSSGAHPVSCLEDKGDLSPTVNGPAREVDQSPPSGAKVENAWSCATSNTRYIFMEACSVNRVG
jgi:hypothetical protein